MRVCAACNVWKWYVEHHSSNKITGKLWRKLYLANNKKRKLMLILRVHRLLRLALHGRWCPPCTLQHVQYLDNFEFPFPCYNPMKEISLAMIVLCAVKICASQQDYDGIFVLQKWSDFMVHWSASWSACCGGIRTFIHSSAMIFHAIPLLTYDNGSHVALT